MTFQEMLEDLDVPPDKAEKLLAAHEAEADRLGWQRAGECLRRVLIRLGRDSVQGRALSRALGFTGEESLARAALAFSVSKQYLHRLRSDAAKALGDLSSSGESDS
ncbi:MAG: hypothetical protein RLZZ15_178 [Verrucomicrobiota bacterium]|jgi:hypothetical protein